MQKPLLQARTHIFQGSYTLEGFLALPKVTLQGRPNVFVTDMEVQRPAHIGRTVEVDRELKQLLRTQHSVLYDRLWRPRVPSDLTGNSVGFEGSQIGRW